VENWFSRTEVLFGKEAVKKLSNARVAVFGIGGVGGYAVEALARAGVGTLGLFDGDRVCLTDINRQIIATRKTLGQFKVDAAAGRVNDINPDAKAIKHILFYCAENSADIDLTEYDYIIDAIDTVPSKIELIIRAKEAGVPIISCMGAGNKIDACGFEVSDIYQTSVCPLAKALRGELKKRGIKALKVVYSKEKPFRADLPESNDGSGLKGNNRQAPASNSFVPGAAGLILAGEAIKQIINYNIQHLKIAEQFFNE
jgi:tRNA A37 threonylcarbamoyladenosine dehydratase